MHSNKISVVMSVYNGESNVESTILSVLNQTYKDFEFIIINDKSSDNTLEIVEKFAIKDKRIRIISNVYNLGLTKSLIKGITASSGKYIARIDSGDLMMKDRLRKQVRILENDIKESIGIVATDCLIYHYNNGEKSISKTILPENDEKVRKKMIYRTCIAHVSVMFRRNIYEKVGGYDKNLSTSQDTDLWIRMLSISKIYSLKEFLTEIIYDDTVDSISLNRNREQRRNGVKIIKKGIKEGNIPIIKGLTSLIYKMILLYTPEKLLDFFRAQKRKIFRSV